MRIAAIKSDSVVDGDGLRAVLFMQGCPHHCDECHNKHTWDKDGGREESAQDVADKILSMLTSTNRKVTISGGEPFYQLDALYELIFTLKANNVHDIWVYTGYTYSNLLDMKQRRIIDVLANIDVLVDGRFEKNIKCHSKFKGSSNQQIIYLKERYTQ